MFLYKEYRQLEVLDPNMPWENILVCAQAAFWTCADPRSQVHIMFFLSLAYHDDTNQ